MHKIDYEFILYRPRTSMPRLTSTNFDICRDDENWILIFPPTKKIRCKLKNLRQYLKIEKGRPLRPAVCDC